MLHNKNIQPLQVVFLLTALYLTSNLAAQIKNITISKKVKVENLYTGLLTQINSSSKHHNSSFQLGSRAHYVVNQNIFKLRGFVAYKFTNSQKKQFFKSYEAIYTPAQSVAIHLGRMATPTTEVRPNPTTWQSQVETNAESTIIGGRKGIKIKYLPSTSLKISYGLFSHKSNTVHHVKVTYKQLAFSSYVEEGSIFSALKWSYKDGILIATRTEDKIAISSLLPISKYYRIHTDIESKNSFKKTTLVTLGLRRNLSINNTVKGFMYLNYKHNSKSWQGGLFLHI